MSTADERQKLAERIDRQIAEAVEACGPGATAYGYYRIRDRTGLEPDRIIYVCRRPEHDGWKPDPPALLDCMPVGPWAQPDEAYGFKAMGEWVRVKRHQTEFSSLKPYRPLSREQIERMQEARRKKALEREADAAPLFGDQIRAEGPAKPKRRKRR